MSGRRVGLDVGGTKCLGVLVDDAGTVLAEHRVPTPHGPDEMVEGLALLAEHFGACDSVGVGIAGLVTRTGVVRASPNLVGIVEFEIGRRLSQRLGRPVEVDNDATCAAVAEWRVGAAQGCHDAVMVTLGTGIGGGVMSAGRLVRGTNGFAGEIGHMVLEPDGPECPCGRRGCWERYASGSGLARLAREAAVAGRLATVLDLVGGDVDSLRGEHVRSAALAGDDEARRLIDDFARWVAIGLANLTNVLDPEVVVLGGGLTDSPELYLPPITRWFSELLYAPSLRPHPALRVAAAGPLAGAVGAALLAEVR